MGKNTLGKENIGGDRLYRQYDEIGEQICIRSGKKQLETSGIGSVIVMVCDMNNLKQINDNPGHQYGDREICKVGEMLLKSFSAVAKCYRIGGDEFCVLAKNADMREFEKCRDAFMSEVHNVLETDYKSSVATGVAMGRAIDTERVFREADYLMYSCKKRNEAK